MNDQFIDQSSVYELKAPGKECPFAVSIGPSSTSVELWSLEVRNENGLRLLKADFADKGSAENAAAEFTFVLVRMVSIEEWRHSGRHLVS